MKKISHQSFVATAVILCSSLLVTPTRATMVFPPQLGFELPGGGIYLVHDPSLTTLVYGTPVVTDSVTQVDASTWKYDFSVTNIAVSLYKVYDDRARLTDYLLPYFSDAALSAIQAPTDWAWRIDADDRFNLGHGAQTLHWYSTSLSSGIAGDTISRRADGMPPDDDGSIVRFGDPGGFGGGGIGATLSGFSFTSDFSPVKAPFLAGFSARPGTWFPGDPALPGSPNAQAAGLNQPFSVSSVPEPATLSLVAAALLLIGVTGRVGRRPARRDQHSVANPSRQFEATPV